MGFSVLSLLRRTSLGLFVALVLAGCDLPGRPFADHRPAYSSDTERRQVDSDDAGRGTKEKDEATDDPEGAQELNSEIAIEEPGSAGSISGGSATDEQDGAAETGGSGGIFTDEELALWRSRAVDGPFKSSGDSAVNSPGEWVGVLYHASKYSEHTRWDGPWDGAIPTDCDHTPYQNSGSKITTYIEAAALKALVHDDPQLARSVGRSLKAHAEDPGLDWNNTLSRCSDRGVAQPVHSALDSMARLGMAYAFVERYLDDSHKAALIDWFVDAGTFASSVARAEVGETLARIPADQRACGESWDDGPRMAGCWLYNNRIASVAQSLAILGVITNESRFLDDAKSISQSYLKYGVGTVDDGTHYFSSDMERAGDYGGYIEGWSYTTSALGSMLMVADLLHRQGDDSLYNFSTTDGTVPDDDDATSTVPSRTTKSLRGFAESFAGWAGGWNKRTHSGQWIDGDTFSSDAVLAIGNRYWDDDKIRSGYLRTADRAHRWPPNVGDGQWLWPAASAMVVPAPLFMYEQSM